MKEFNRGICLLAVIPVRSEASDKSEIVTQLLFGETVRVLAQHEQWLKIESEFDQYEGWIDHKQIKPIDEETLIDKKTLTGYPILVQQDKKKLILSPGSDFFSFKERKFIVNNLTYSLLDFQENKTSFHTLVNLFLGVPYLWGGRSIMGIDCSGFTQIIAKILGVNLKRDAYQQAAQGCEILFETLKEGDLVFFANNKQKIIHVGFYLTDNRIIHASGEVRIDQLTQVGIWNNDLQHITHHFHSARRIFFNE